MLYLDSSSGSGGNDVQGKTNDTGSKILSEEEKGKLYRMENVHRNFRNGNARGTGRRKAIYNGSKDGRENIVCRMPIRRGVLRNPVPQKTPEGGKRLGSLRRDLNRGVGGIQNA